MKILLLLSGFCAVPLFLKFLIKLKYKRPKKNLENNINSYFYHVLNRNHRNFNCVNHSLKDTIECSDSCAILEINRLVSFISSAKNSISLCMYITTLKSVHEALIKAHERGVRVRMISDKIMLKEISSRHKRLTELGVPVKFQPNAESLMHHKFCLIDETNRETAKMFFGSTNLTKQALVQNYDSSVMTNDWNIICRFSEEFEEIWANIKYVD